MSKAIVVKVLAETENRGRRLKAWSDSGSLIEDRDWSLDIEYQAMFLCSRYIREVWDGTVEPTGFGVLPNGDYVCTVGQMAKR